jgi:hypothetical protein
MYRYRVHVNGGAAVVAAAVGELTAAGAALAERGRPSRLVMRSPDGIEMWESLSRRHPDATFGLESFEELEDELLEALVEDGRVTVLARHGVLPDDWGSCHDEDGTPLDPELLRAAAEAVVECRSRREARTLDGSVEVVLTTGKALGDLCHRLERAVRGGPARDALEAVTELAVLALEIGSAGGSRCRDELDHEESFRLTQSLVHAGVCELWDEPGGASWSEWTQTLVSSTAHLLDAAWHWEIRGETGSHAVAAEHYGTADEHLRWAARSLLTTCLQTLALFDDVGQSVDAQR